MPRRIYKYNRPEFVNTLPEAERKARNAHIYLERLRETDPKFNSNVLEIALQARTGALGEKEANFRIHAAIMDAIARERQRD